MTIEAHEQHAPRGLPDWAWYAGAPVASVIWWLLHGQLIPFSEWATSLFPVTRDSHTGEAVAFFVYEVPKVLLLQTGIVFVTGVLRCWFSPEKTRALLAGKRQIWGLGLSAGCCTGCADAVLFLLVGAGILATDFLFNAIL